MLQEITEAGIRGEGTHLDLRVVITEVESLDREGGNHLYHGRTARDSLTRQYGFVMESGNMRGTVIRCWELAEEPLF